MTNRVKLTYVDKDADFDEVRRVITESGFSRIPVFTKGIEEVEGILHAKDLLVHLYEEDKFAWQELIYPPYFVPESKKIDQLLQEMQQNRSHIAVVADEYANIAGIITLEDILEQVVGEIVDESDKDEEVFVQNSETDFTFDGSTNLLDICRVVGLDEFFFDEVKGESDSLIGLLTEINGSFPEISETIKYVNLDFTVLSCDENGHIDQVKISIDDSNDIPKQAY